jgi:hypothetical protein
MDAMRPTGLFSANVLAVLAPSLHRGLSNAGSRACSSALARRARCVRCSSPTPTVCRRSHGRAERVRRRGRRPRRAAVCSRVGERANHLQELDNRAWPAVRKKNGQRLLVSRPDAQKMETELVDFSAELRKDVDSSFEMTPVVIRAPVVDEALQAIERYALRPASLCLALGPSSHGEPPLDVVKIGLRFGDVKRYYDRAESSAGKAN